MTREPETRLSLAQTARKNQKRLKTIIKVLTITAAVLGLIAKFSDDAY